MHLKEFIVLCSSLQWQCQSFTYNFDPKSKCESPYKYGCWSMGVEAASAIEEVQHISENNSCRTGTFICDFEKHRVKACLHSPLLQLNLELDVAMCDVLLYVAWKTTSQSLTQVFLSWLWELIHMQVLHQVSNQAGPEMIWEHQLYLLDAEVQKQTHIRWSDVHQFFVFCFICMYDKFWVWISQ